VSDEATTTVLLVPAITSTPDWHFDDELQGSVRIEPRRRQRRSLLQYVKDELVAPLRGVS
jgi:hypothetical protein